MAVAFSRAFHSRSLQRALEMTVTRAFVCGRPFTERVTTVGAAATWPIWRTSTNYMATLLARVDDRTRFERRTALKPHPLVGTTLAPALTGGRGWVGSLSTSQGTGRVAFVAAGHPPEVPLTSGSGGGGGERGQRRGRWLKKFSYSYPQHGRHHAAPSKPVTALVLLERWRGL